MDDRYLKYIPCDDIYLFNTGRAEKAWLCFGCIWVEELKLHRLIVWAPNAMRVSLVGNFNDWNPDADPMEPFEGGVWVIFKAGLKDGDLYKFCIDGADSRRVLKSDPFANLNQCGSDTASVVSTKSDFAWTDGEFLKKRAQTDFLSAPMSVYEVHAGAWRHFPSDQPIYRSLADELSEYCREMGYTHVELMPVTEYPFDGSWGYQVTGYYAPTSRYGGNDDFRYFVDTMHASGISVIIDWVPAHFPKDEHGLAMFDGTPQFECYDARMAQHPEWGTLIFDYASDQVKSFLISSACKFFEVYHIDGIRVDAVTSMLYLNYGRKPGEWTPNREGGSLNLDAIAFLRQLNSTVLQNYPGAVTIAEESTAFPLVTAPPHDGGLGFCLKWSMGFMHDTLDYMAMDSLFRKDHHDKLTFSMMYIYSENYVLPYSHDEVVHGKKSMLNKMFGDYDERFSSLRTLYAFQFGHPGKKLSFMGNEFGQFIEFDEKRELDWFLLDYPRHREMQRFCAALNSLYLRYPALHENDRNWDGFQWLNVNDRERSSVAFMRRSGKSSVICVYNFTPVSYSNFVIGLPEQGTLRLLLNSDEYRFGGQERTVCETVVSASEPFLEWKHSTKLMLPGMSALFYEFSPSKGNQK